MTGLHLSHYRIDAELGRGGMGVVYRAFDTKLDRTVAVKVLPSKALATEDDRARFFREAKAAASLHHPNIATVFGIDEAVPLTEAGAPAPGQTESRLFIAMEYIDGETLRDRIEQGPLKLDEAVTIASQIAEALKAAHANDIVHRDIKSANVMLTSDGVAKVLDFGLAKTQASTMLTQLGSTLGTVAYMSPEQARGEEVDGRSDLYSLGTVLYEMIAGRLPFGGDYEQAILYSILNEDPEPLTAVRTGVPIELERITLKLLDKERGHRYQTARDLVADLDRAKTAPLPSSRAVSTAASPEVARRPKWSRIWLLIPVALAVGWLTGKTTGTSQPSQPRQTVRFSIDTGSISPSSVDISPGGDYVAFSGRDTSSTSQIQLYEVATGDIQVLPGSEGGRGPRFSPDGTEIAFAQASSYQIYRMGTRLPVELYSPPAGLVGGHEWAGDNLVVPTYTAAGFQAVSRAGELLSSVVPDTSENSFLVPGPGIDGDRVLAGAGRAGRGNTGDVVLANLSSGTYETLVQQAINPFLVGRHLVYEEVADLDDGGPNRYRAQAVAQDLQPIGGRVTLPTGFPRGTRFSRSGHAVWTGASGNQSRVTEWINLRDGSRVPFEQLLEPVLSPDGSRVVGRTGDELLIRDIASGATTRIDAAGSNPVWSANGDYLYFGSNLGGSTARVRTDGTPGTERIDWAPVTLDLSHASPDGRFLLGRDLAPPRRAGFISLADSTWSALKTTYEGQWPSKFSPDSRYILLTGGDPTRVMLHEIDTGTEWPISGPGETPYRPTFSPDGLTVYYYDRANGVVSQRSVNYTGGITIGEAVVIGATPLRQDFVVALTAHPDGERLLVTYNRFPESENRIDVILNYDLVLEELAPVRNSRVR